VQCAPVHEWQDAIHIYAVSFRLRGRPFRDVDPVSFLCEGREVPPHSLKDNNRYQLRTSRVLRSDSSATIYVPLPKTTPPSGLNTTRGMNADHAFEHGY
jgi:hypothetical protein